MDVMVWVDGPLPKAAGLEAWARGVADVADVAGVWTPKEGALHMSRWDTGRLVDALRALQAQGVKTRLTVWATSSVARWTQQAEWLARVFEACAVGGVERPGLDLDAESAWAGTATMESIAAFARRWDLDVSANYVPGLHLSRQVRELALAEWVSELIPQAYSQYQPAVAWTHADLIRPRTFQRHALTQLAGLNAARTTPARLRVGIMAAFQTHPDPHPKGLAALDAALDEARILGVHDVALWSAKHLSRPAVRGWAEGLRAR